MTKKTHKKILVASFATVLVVSMMAALPLAYAAGHVIIKDTEIKVKNLETLTVDIKVNAKIPKDGSSGAFGYGIFTNGIKNVLALTTHAGVLDHSDQEGDANDPVFHAHVLDVMAPSTVCAGFDAEVDLLGSVATGNKLIQFIHILKHWVNVENSFNTTI